MPSYRLGIGDKLKVSVKYLSDVNLFLTVLPDGSINLPRIGSVVVHNLTISEANQLITNSYTTILRNPQVFLDLITTRPILINVTGEVQKPGIYSLGLKRLSRVSNSDDGEASSVSSEGWPTLIDGIQKAGGFTDKADIRFITLTRSDPINVNQDIVLKANLWNSIDKGLLDDNHFVFSDTPC